MGEPSSSTVLPLLAALPLSSPSLATLLETHKPFVRPSLLPGSAGPKFLARLNSAILSREAALEEKHACLRIAKELIEQDQEGWVLATWGKGWVGAVLGALSASNVSLGTVRPHLTLLQTLILASPASPSFEREAIHPIMGKVSTTLLKLVEKAIGQSMGKEDALLYILIATRHILVHSPAAFRPTINALRTLILPLIIAQPAQPVEIREAAISLLTSLHLCQGKAAVAQGWRAEMGDAMAGIAVSLDGIVADGWLGDARPSAAFPPGLSPFPVDAPSRLPIALYALEGYTEIALALLNQSTSRPVPVPLARIVRLGIRCLDLNLATPTVAYISPQYHANLVAGLPHIWTAGMLLLGTAATSCGDHLLLHLTDIVDTTLHLAETTPDSYIQTQTQLIRLHHLLLDQYPSAVWYPDHPPRLLKLCLSKLSVLLDPASNRSETAAINGSSQKGKKRARGEEDGLIASLEGRDCRRIGNEGDVALEALQLIPKLHVAPLLPPSLLTLSIRIHLSLYLALPALSPRRFADPTLQQRLIGAIRHVLESACLAVEEGGHSRGWKSVIMGVLEPTQSRLTTLLHPQLPALPRPAPPLSALHFFTAESEEEAKYRQELGLHTATISDDDEDGIEVEPEEVVETVVVPVAPNDVRAGQRDVADSTLSTPVPGYVRVQDPDTPQPGHHPPTPAPTITPGISTAAAPVTEKSLARSQDFEATATPAMPIPSAAESNELQQDFIAFGQVGRTTSSKVASGMADLGKMEVDGDGSDVGIPDLDSENSEFDDDEYEEDEE